MPKINNPFSNDYGFKEGPAEKIKKAVGRFIQGPAKNDKTKPPRPQFTLNTESPSLASRLKPRQFASQTIDGQQFLIFRKSDRGDPSQVRDTPKNRKMLEGYNEVHLEQLEMQSGYATKQQRIIDRVMVDEVVKRFKDVPKTENGLKNCIVLNQGASDDKVIIYQGKNGMIARRFPESEVNSYLEKHGLTQYTDIRREVVADAKVAAQKRVSKEKVLLREEEDVGAELADRQGKVYKNRNGSYTAIAKRDGSLAVERFKSEADAYLSLQKFKNLDIVRLFDE